MTLRETRYVDTARIDALAGRLTDELDRHRRARRRLPRGEDAFTGYHEEIERLVGRGRGDRHGRRGRSRTRAPRPSRPTAWRRSPRSSARSTSPTPPCAPRSSSASARCSPRSTAPGPSLTARRRELLDGEGRAAFAAEFALLGQSVTGRARGGRQPRRCDEQLGRCCCSWRTSRRGSPSSTSSSPSSPPSATEVYEAFSARKQALLDERRAAPTGWPQSADAHPGRRPAPGRRRWRHSTRSTPTSPPTRWWPRSAASPTELRDARRPRARRGARRPAQGRAPGRRPGAARPRSTCTRAAARPSGSAGTGSRSTPSRST